MYPLFDQKVQYLSYCKSCIRVYLVLLLIGSVFAALFYLMKFLWLSCFCCLLVFVFLICVTFFYYKMVLSKDSKKVSLNVVNMKFFNFFDTEFLGYSLPDDLSSLYDDSNLDHSLEIFSIKATMTSGEKKLLKVFYTDKKANFLKSFLKRYSLEEYPLLITYYKKSRVIDQIHLLDDIDYPEDFKNNFEKFQKFI